jgi:hypothetical protein
MPATKFIATCLLALGLAFTLHAYPPMPDHILYGQVRDELGNPLQIDSGEVLLETASGTQITTHVVPGLELGVNYRLAVPMDAGLTQDRYKPTALRPTVPFKLRVRIGNTVYVPLEMQGHYANLGAPAQRTRLDLTLGEDADGDGLPDAWERALIAASGRPLTLADIRAEDDFDGDGLSNLQEYLAGTYAFDPQDGFVLDLLAAEDDVAVLEFLVIRGHSYTLQAADELGLWSPLAFRVTAPQREDTPRQYYYATDVRVLRVEPLSEGQSQRFFRLLVQ